MAVVLVVEDEVQVLVLTESCLQELGHKTLSAATAAEALAILETEELIDVLFIDIGLQDDLQAGLALAMKAVEGRPDIKVLYATGQPVTDGTKALMVEGSAILQKPYTMSQLEASLTVHFGIRHGLVGTVPPQAEPPATPTP
ncbi:MAG TPA: response regulator [Xanthobacteraceae bacterium]|nr:response regulator [Xanthobacteraceae bacterium]